MEGEDAEYHKDDCLECIGPGGSPHTTEKDVCENYETSDQRAEPIRNASMGAGASGGKQVRKRS